MLPKLFIVSKLLMLLGVTVTGSAQGSLAYYHNTEIEHVCQRRVANGWNHLNCSFPCQIASISNHVGEYWLIVLPNCRGKTVNRLCLVVDCAREEDIDRLRARNEVVEISGELARYCGYRDYVDDVYVWRLGSRP